VSVTAEDLQTARKHLDNLASDDTPTYRNLGLVFALEAVLERAAAMPGPCCECAHWDVDSGGFCTNTRSPRNGKAMGGDDGCAAFEAE